MEVFLKLLIIISIEKCLSSLSRVVGFTTFTATEELDSYLISLKLISKI